MKSVFKILQEIALTPSRNKKEEILNLHKDNVDLKEVIRLAYDPFTNFWIKKIPTYTSQFDNSLEWGLKELSVLSSREKTGGDGIAYLSYILTKLSADNADIIARVVSRDLRCGFDAGTANKVWDHLIFEYPCMLCSQNDEKVLAKMKFPAYFQMKLDGKRFNAIVKDGKVEYRSRNGKLIDLFGILDDVFIKMANGENLVFDGELLVLDDNYKPLPRQIGNGILSRASNGKATKKDLEMVACVLWDVISYDGFIKGYQKETYTYRFAVLQGKVKGFEPRVTLVDSHIVKDMDEVQELYKAYLEDGQEGGILKSFDGFWEDKRTKSQIKFKAELECDLICTGWEFGNVRTKNEKRLGKLNLASADGLITVDVGSGFSDEQRDTIKPKDVIGKIVAIKYNTRIKGRKGPESLFLPVFIEIRDDKTIADNAKDIK